MQAFRGEMASIRLYIWLALVLAATSEQLLFVPSLQGKSPNLGHGYSGAASPKDSPRLLLTESLPSHTGLPVSS